MCVVVFNSGRICVCESVRARVCVCVCVCVLLLLLLLLLFIERKIDEWMVYCTVHGLTITPLWVNNYAYMISLKTQSNLLLI